MVGFYAKFLLTFFLFIGNHCTVQHHVRLLLSTAFCSAVPVALFFLHFHFFRPARSFGGIHM